MKFDSYSENNINNNPIIIKTKAMYFASFEAINKIIPLTTIITGDRSKSLIFITNYV